MARLPDTATETMEKFFAQLKPWGGHLVWQGGINPDNGYGQYNVRRCEEKVHEDGRTCKGHTESIHVISFFYSKDFPKTDKLGKPLPEESSLAAFLERLRKKVFVEPGMEVHHACDVQLCGDRTHLGYVPAPLNRSLIRHTNGNGNGNGHANGNGNGHAPVVEASQTVTIPEYSPYGRVLDLDAWAEKVRNKPFYQKRAKQIEAEAEKVRKSFEDNPISAVGAAEKSLDKSRCDICGGWRPPNYWDKCRRCYDQWGMFTDYAKKLMGIDKPKKVGGLRFLGIDRVERR